MMNKLELNKLVIPSQPTRLVNKFELNKLVILGISLLLKKQKKI